MPGACVGLLRESSSGLAHKQSCPYKDDPARGGGAWGKRVQPPLEVGAGGQVEGEVVKEEDDVTPTFLSLGGQFEALREKQIVSYVLAFVRCLPLTCLCLDHQHIWSHGSAAFHL